MGAGEIRKLKADSRETFVEAPRGRRERPICQWVRGAEDGRLVALWFFESDVRRNAERADYAHAA